MDFEKAIRAHVQWKSKLIAYIANPNHSVNAATVAKDDSCELGKWIHGEGQKHSKSPEFAKLVTDHARFHSAAADIVRKADAGQHVSQEVALGAKSDYASASTAVISELMRLNRAD